MFEDIADLGTPQAVVALADDVDGIDVDALDEALRSGRGRAEVKRHTAESRTDLVAGSPTLVLPDGSAHHNPGISMHWEDQPGERLVIESDDPDVYVALVNRTMATRPAD